MDFFSSTMIEKYLKEVVEKLTSIDNKLEKIQSSVLSKEDIEFVKKEIIESFNCCNNNESHLLKKDDSKKVITIKHDFDIKKLIEKSNYVNSKCITELIDVGCGIKSWYHTLPLKDKEVSFQQESNWDLSSREKEIISQYLLELKEYAKYVYSVEQINREWIERKFNSYLEILPPWIVFPHYPADTIGWRMGVGESYKIVAHEFLNYLTDDELILYQNTYDVPTYYKNPNKK